MIWEYRINYLSTKIILSVSELIQKQVKKFIHTVLLQPVQIQAWFQEVLFVPCRRNLTCYAKAKQFIDDY